MAKSMEVGTPGYCAPELLMRADLVSSYDGKKADGASRSCAFVGIAFYIPVWLSCSCARTCQQLWWKERLLVRSAGAPFLQQRRLLEQAFRSKAEPGGV